MLNCTITNKYIDLFCSFSYKNSISCNKLVIKLLTLTWQHNSTKFQQTNWKNKNNNYKTNKTKPQSSLQQTGLSRHETQKSLTNIITSQKYYYCARCKAMDYKKTSWHVQQTISKDAFLGPAKNGFWCYNCVEVVDASSAWFDFISVKNLNIIQKLLTKHTDGV